VGLKQLEAAYLQERGYDFELSKTISLQQLNPLALLQLKETGVCEFEILEVLFDMDYPGHYKRRIKSVSLSIPCIAGPYTNVNATLRLLEHSFRNTAVARDGNDYPRNMEDDDPRFVSFNIPITAIGTSTGLSDSGVFEVNFKDDRYLPFEGAGAISKWRLELPSVFRQFDYYSITEAVIQVRYTSEDGGDKLKKAATEALLNYVKSVEDLSQKEGLFTIVDLRHDFANEWYKAFSNGRTMSLGNLNERLPIFTRTFDAKKIKAKDVYIASTDSVKSTDLTLQHKDADLDAFGGAVKVGESLSVYHLADQDETLDSWSLKFSDTLPEPDKMWLLIRYTLS